MQREGWRKRGGGYAVIVGEGFRTQSLALIEYRCKDKNKCRAALAWMH